MMFSPEPVGWLFRKDLSSPRSFWHTWHRKLGNPSQLYRVAPPARPLVLGVADALDLGMSVDASHERLAMR
jgi:hypothetical protein